MATSDSSTLHIIVPVYNEGKNFARLYNEIHSKIHSKKQLIIVYDFDEDDTLPIARKLTKNDPEVRLVKNTLGRGALNAIKTGFNQVKVGPLVVVMADLADDLSAVDPMFQEYLQGAQLVCGSRYMRGGKQIGGPLLKRSLSRLAGLSLYYMKRFPTHDITNNFKLYDKSLLEQITIESAGGFEIAMEITAKAYRSGAVIKEVPSTWHDRTAGESNFRLWQWLPSYLKWYRFALFS